VLPLATQSSYYAVVAQIIPVFLLILVVGEGRLRARSSHFDGVFLGATLYQVVVLIIGELCALRILVSGSESSFLRAMVAASVALALGNVVMHFLHSQLSDFDPEAEREDRPPKHFWLIGAFGVLTVFGAFAVLTVGI
jgi:hypothetical protein